MERPSSSPVVERIAAKLAAAPRLDCDTLAAALAQPITLEDVDRWVAFDAANYRRNLVLRTPAFELRLLCYLPRQRTSLHGHDGSACAFRILRGTSTEIRLRQPDRHWTPGTVVREDGRNLVHQVTNLGDEPLISLHAYAPPLPMDQPPSRYDGRQIVIIGGGAAGAALAIHLLGTGSRALRVVIVEKRQWLGRGPAYGTTDPSLRLNVPAGRMSLLPERPDDFVDWAGAQGAAVPATSLLPRQLFGEYVEDRLAQAIAAGPGKVWLHRAEAVAASERGVLLGDGTFLPAEAVVLATGNQAPSAPAAIGPQLLRSHRVIGDPWNADALRAIDPHEEVLVVGTGLTAVDVVQALRAQDHRGQVTMVSRRGLLPRAHLSPGDTRLRAVALQADRLPRAAGALSRWLRVEARRLEAEGVGWQNLIDALRPHTTTLWNELPAVERARFMRRLRPFWEVLRHRAPADALAQLHGWRSRGALEVAAGEILAVDDGDDGLRVTLARGGRGGTRSQRRFDRIVLCTGPETDVRRWSSLLFRRLLGDGRIQADPLGLGIVTDGAGRAVGEDGAPVPWLYTVGGLRRPQLWETTAVPDIVRQASALARTLIG